MKKMIFFLFISVCVCNCSSKKKAIDFINLQETEFNAAPFQFPDSEIFDSTKQAHDSCMGFSFDANAMLARTRNSFFIGDIINRRSLEVVDSLSNLGLPETRLISDFNVITNPCYEKRVLQLPLKSLLGDNFMLRFPAASEALNKEINDAISASDNAEMKTGSWIYLDMKHALKNMLDTAQSPGALRYRENMLDTSNMVLMAVESVMDISFIINTGKDISASLQDFLKSKPTVPQPDSHSSIQIFYINNNKFQVTFNGFFPVVGQLMKAIPPN